MLNQLMILTLLDYVEIMFFSTVIYYFSLWIAQDSHKNLLAYFYGYCILIGITYTTQLNSIYFFLTFFAPVILIFFIIMHESTLQKNYVMLRNTVSSKKEERNWLDRLIRICLSSMNNNMPLICIIERSNSLTTALKDAVLLEASIHTGILEMLINAPTFNPEKMVWVNKQGTLIGINAQWKHHADPVLVNESAQKMALFQQHALFYTTKTDAILLRSDPITHTFDIIADGMIFESVNTNTALKCLKKYLNHSPNSYTNLLKGKTHGTVPHTPNTHNQKQHNA